MNSERIGMRKFLPKFFLGLALMSSETIHVRYVASASAATGSSDRGHSVTNQVQLLGTWSLTGVSVEDQKVGRVNFSGRAFLRFRADGVVMAEFSKYSLSFSDHAVYGECTGYQSGLFSVANGIVSRSETIVVGINGNCDGVRFSPAVTRIQDQKHQVVIRGSTVRISSDIRVLNKGVTRNITIHSSFTRMSKETWDGSGVDPRLSGSYKLTKLYADSTCKSSDINELKGELPISGLWTFHATGNSYISKNEAFKIGPSEACTGVTRGHMTGAGLSIKWTQSSSSSQCMGSESSDHDQMAMKRDIMGLPSQNFVTATTTKFPNKDCDDGFSYLTLIFIYERQSSLTPRR
jgi:hypothetical protein